MAKCYLSLLVLLVLATSSKAQPVASDKAVQLTVSTQVSPPQISLQWKKLTGTTSYVVSKKPKGSNSWSNLATVTATDSTYTDAAVNADSSYEYSVVTTGSVPATGYAYAAVRGSAIHSRGGLILLVDSTFRDSCKAEIATLMNDLRGDGWAVTRHYVGRYQSVTAIRSMVIADYNAKPNTTALLLLGHIPVPYSGNLNPDAHPDHLGAWPTDAFYADIDGTWTDVSINSTSASRPQNRNIPGDGKWDQSAIPTEVELQTGRIDFANMPAITRTEVQMMRNYLNKSHNYKMDALAIKRKAVIDDNFGYFSAEAFAANAWRLFPVLIGRANIVVADYKATLNDSAYQWAYGCGGGSHTSAGGIGATAAFDTTAVKGIFSMMFGSYFGDWDAQNNFLRAPMCATEPALTSCWAGRPNWFLHHMSLGEPIGYSALLSQNNYYVYDPPNYAAGGVHTSLMGDPTLRTDYVKPPQNLVIAPITNAGANLSWTASADALVVGYYVYRSDSEWGNYKRISSLVTATTFTDAQGTSGKKYYLLRPAKLQQTPSGSYYNLGIGIVDTATVSYPLSSVTAISTAHQLTLFPNPATNKLNVVVDCSSPIEAAISITDATGKIMGEQKHKLHTGENNLSWDVSAYPVGIYILSIKANGSTTSSKWIRMEGQ